jgi:Putative transposase/Transposase zinc-binding domain
MTTLTEVFQRYGPAYRASVGPHLPPNHRTAMAAIEACRTDALGGQLFTCPECQTTRYCYHSCRNRHCPTCQHDATQHWLDKQQALLLPVPYFLVTFTLPAGLRAVARANQRQIYDIMFRSSAAALQQLAADPRFLGGALGMLGVLQTWTRDLRYHPHIHYLVPAVGVAPDGTIRQPATATFLVPVRPLAVLFRAKVRAALRQTPLAADVATDVWEQDWVVDCRPVGSGTAALKYLAPYIFRVALSNNRIVNAEDGQITFRYKHREDGARRTTTLPAAEFIHRFLQHVLPKGFVKVRYYGLFGVGQRAVLKRVRAQLAFWRGVEQLCPSPDNAPASERSSWRPPCPQCGQPMYGSPVCPADARAPPFAHPSSR